MSQPQNSERLKRHNIPSLTGIRGVAAIWVMLFHLRRIFPGFIPGGPFVDAGYHAVDLFFLLSGFILMYVHDRDFAKPSWWKAWEFYAARVTRVYPLNAAVLVCILVAFRWQTNFIVWSRILQPGAYSAAGFIQTLFLTNRWGRSLGEWNEPTWSLSLEIIGYVLFPLLVMIILRIKSTRLIAVLALSSLAALIAFQAVTHTLYINSIGRLGVVRMLLGFFCGMLICQLTSFLQSSYKFPKQLEWISCALIFGCIFFTPMQPLIIFPFASLIFALFYREGFVSVVLSSGVAVYLGRISFALYLVHIPIFRYTAYLLAMNEPNVSTPVKYVEIALAIVLSFALATIMYRFVEAPMHRIGRRLFGTKKPALPVQNTVAMRSGHSS